MHEEIAQAADQMMMYRCYSKALIHVVGDRNRNSVAHHTCHGLSSASGYTARQYAVDSVQVHSIGSLVQMSSSISQSLHIL